MLDCEPHGNLEVRGYEGSNTEAYLGSQKGRFYLRVKFSFQIKLYAYWESKNYKVIEKLFICLEGEKGSENFMVCKILEYVVLYVEEVKKGTSPGMIYFHPNRLVVIYQIHASCFISSRLGMFRVTCTVYMA